MQDRISGNPPYQRLPAIGDGSQPNSDSEDWTLVTPPQSKSASPDRQAFVVLNEPSASKTNASVLIDQRQRANDENREQRIDSKPTHSATGGREPKSMTKATTKRDDECLASGDGRVKLNNAKTSKTTSCSHSQTEDKLEAETTPEGPCEGVMYLFCFVISACLVVSLIVLFRPSRNERLMAKILESKNQVFNSFYSDPSNHAYTELKLLDEELIDCIKRENPNFEGISMWLDNQSLKEPLDYDSIPKLKPIMGMVCYSHENEWRRKFERLKTEYSFDVARTVKRVRSQLSYEALERRHPTLRFRFIMNQLDYLNTLEQRRKDREIERLKAENLELKRRQKAPTVSRGEAELNGSLQQVAGNRQQQQQGMQVDNALVSLEGENRRLRIENEMLKQSLGEKAGTVFIKQSIELERCERENNNLRNFHQQVASEVSRGFKQINVPILDFGAMLNDRDESLSTRLEQTRGHLARLVDETGVLVAKNQTIQAELDEARLLNALVVREAQNLIEGNTTNDSESAQLLTNATATTEGSASKEIGTANDLETDPLRELDNLKCGGSSECLATKVNWLMKRAKLREKLRKAQQHKQNDAPGGHVERPSGRHGRSAGHKMSKRSHRY